MLAWLRRSHAPANAMTRGLDDLSCQTPTSHWPHLTHAHLLYGESLPNCSTCQSKIAVEHLLLHCSDFDSQRSHFLAKTLNELIHQVPPRSTIQFLKDINMYYIQGWVVTRYK